MGVRHSKTLIDRQNVKPSTGSNEKADAVGSYCGIAKIINISSR